MKKTKRFLAFLLAMVMVLGLTINVAAAEDYSITVTNTNTSITMAGNTYSAYKVFDVTYSGTSYAYTVDDDFSGFTYTDDKGTSDTSDDATYSGENLITYVAGLKNAQTNVVDTDALNDFAEAVLKYATDNSISVDASVTVDSTDTTETATISLTQPGYYLVAGSATSSADASEKVVATCSLDTTDPTMEVSVKADVPTLDKAIVETTGDVDYNNAAIGDTVSFKLTSDVPNMQGYDKYYYVVEDTLSKGLTFDDTTAVVIKMDGTALTKDTDYTVTTAASTTNTEETVLKIVFKDFIQYAEKEGKTIEITYSAKVDTDAVIGTTGNANTASLTYSNNPNYDYKGTDEPTDDEKTDDNVVGETPDTITYTYVTALQIKKVDGETPANPLTGAEFELSGTTLETVLVTGQEFVVDANGTYYLLKDGTYTDTAPTTDTTDLYQDTTTKYVKNTLTDEVEETNSGTVNVKAYVGADGTLTFEGLSAGTYTIEEITAPDGYNILAAPLTVVIDWAMDGTTCKWTVGTGSNAATTYDEANNMYVLQVVNESGSILPSTGGIGTTIFYIVGGVLVFGAIVFFVTKKRMDSEE